MIRRRTFCLLLLATAIAIPCNASPVVMFHDSAVEITSITPGARVALLVVAHEPRPHHLRMRTFHEELTDEDRDRVIRYEMPNGIGSSSIWIVAEIPSGQVGVFSPRGPVNVHDVPPAALRSPEALAIGGDLLEILYLRPAAGSWHVSASDSGMKDADRKPDGFVTISFPHLQPVGKSPSSPDGYRLGDVVIAVDPIDLRVYRFGQGA